MMRNRNNHPGVGCLWLMLLMVGGLFLAAVWVVATGGAG